MTEISILTKENGRLLTAISCIHSGYVNSVIEKTVKSPFLDRDKKQLILTPEEANWLVKNMIIELDTNSEKADPVYKLKEGYWEITSNIIHRKPRKIKS